MIIDKNVSWGFFNGAKQGVPPKCGAGRNLFLGETYYMKFRERLGHGTNNEAQIEKHKMVQRQMMLKETIVAFLFIILIQSILCICEK